MTFSKVDLPQPEGPTRATKLPSVTLRSTACGAGVWRPSKIDDFPTAQTSVIARIVLVRWCSVNGDCIEMALSA